MSKSAPLAAPGVIRMLDRPKVIQRKIRRAVTDSDTVLSYDPTGRPGIANIAEITAALSNRTPTDVLDKCSGYGQLKNTCADAIIAELEPIQRRHDELLGDPAELDRVLQRRACWDSYLGETRTRPLWYARTTAWVRSREPVFIKIRDTCVRTVASLSTSRSVI